MKKLLPFLVNNFKIALRAAACCGYAKPSRRKEGGEWRRTRESWWPSEKNTSPPIIVLMSTKIDFLYLKGPDFTQVQDARHPTLF